MLKRDVLVEITVKSTGASAKSVKRIVDEEGENKSPGKSKPKRKKAFNRLDEFDLGVIRRMMHSFYARGKAQHSKTAQTLLMSKNVHTTI